MTRELNFLQQQLQGAKAILASKTIAAGFDGFIDSIVKVVKFKTDEETAYFQTIKSFGEYVTAKSGSGFSLESEELQLKMGGNMPIMANAMANIGASVHCVGAFGIPAIHPAFAEMHPACKLISYTNPGTTTAMEFTDGKMMLAQMTGLNHAGWDTIKAAIGINKLKIIFGTADLVCLVNWSEPDQSNMIWQGLIDEVFKDEQRSISRQFFFDLSDCSKRHPPAIVKVIALIRQFGKHGNVTLSLNRNEAAVLYKTLISENPPAELSNLGDKLFAELNINILVIHSAKMSLAWDETGVYTHIPAFVEHPLVSTGAGDNFNAGFCLAQLLGLDARLSLILANAASHSYITSGKSPGLDELNAYFSG